MIDLLKKGNFKPIDNEFLLEGFLALEEVAKVQEKWQKGDTDSFIYEIRDSMVGHYLGYELINTDKHGFDCKLSQDKDVFLEVKAASYDAKTWAATFNDTTIEKAKYFQGDQVYLCLAVWKKASDLLFMVYGKNAKLGYFLEEKVKSFLKGEAGVRSTQTVSLGQLIFDYGFDIVCIKPKNEVKTILKLKSKQFFNIPDSCFISQAEFTEKYCNATKYIISENRKSWCDNIKNSE